MANISWWNNWAIQLSFSRFHYSSLSFSFTFFFLTIWQTCCRLCPRPCSCPANCSCPGPCSCLQTCPCSHPHSHPGKKDLQTGVTEGYPGEAKGCFTGYFGLGCGHLKASIPKLLPDPNNNARLCQIGISSWNPWKTRLWTFDWKKFKNQSTIIVFKTPPWREPLLLLLLVCHRWIFSWQVVPPFTWYLDPGPDNLSSSRLRFLALAPIWPANVVLV